MTTTSKHYRNDRAERNAFIRDVIGYGNKIKEVIIDRGHKDGAERHELSDTGVITVYNLNTGKLITRWVARPNQLRRFYQYGVPQTILKIAYSHYLKQYNEI